MYIYIPIVCDMFSQYQYTCNIRIVFIYHLDTSPAIHVNTLALEGIMYSQCKQQIGLDI